MCLYSGKVKLYGRVFFGLVQSLSDHLGFSTEKCAVYMALHKYLALVFLFFLQLFFSLIFSELDDTDGGLDQARVKEKESVDSNPPTPGSSEGHRLSHTVRMSRSMTVSVEDEDHQVDEADGK